MAPTYDELHAMTVAQLRKVADDIEDERLQGHNTMHQEPLLKALCEVLGIEAHVHHEVVGIDKTAIKRQIRALKVERDAAMQARDKKKLKEVRMKIHRLKHRIHKATV
jgi:hypothetical protein